MREEKIKLRELFPKNHDDHDDQYFFAKIWGHLLLGAMMAAFVVKNNFVPYDATQLLIYAILTPFLAIVAMVVLFLGKFCYVFFIHSEKIRKNTVRNVLYWLITIAIPILIYIWLNQSSGE